MQTRDHWRLRRARRQIRRRVKRAPGRQVRVPRRLFERYERLLPAPFQYTDTKACRHGVRNLMLGPDRFIHFEPLPRAYWSDPS